MTPTILRIITHNLRLFISGFKSLPTMAVTISTSGPEIQGNDSK